jgi:hypothetical protein
MVSRGALRSVLADSIADVAEGLCPLCHVATSFDQENGALSRSGPNNTAQ